MAPKTIKKTPVGFAGLCLLLVLAAVPVIVVAKAVPASAAAKASTTAPANSASTNPSLISAVAQSYNAGPDVLTGMLVQPKDRSTVVPVGASDAHKMSGVVAPIDGADIVLTTPSAQSRQVLVAPSGRYNLLVSSQNGPIKAGDYLSISALPGVAMEADPDQSEVVARAVGEFDGKTNIVDTMKLKNDSGQASTVAIGYIQADIHLAPNPLRKNSNFVPGILARAAQGVANKQVSAARIYLSIAVIVATFFVTGSMVYGGMRGSMTAIGRNPLAKGVVSRGMLQSVIFGMIVFLLGVLAAYGLLL